VCVKPIYIYKDGHTNIDAERSCLDSTFTIPNIKIDGFTIVIGNPPFGDEIKQGERDRLGDGSLEDFELSRGYDQISSELVVPDYAFRKAGAQNKTLPYE
jgi:type I restriction enzyme M protein